MKIAVIQGDGIGPSVISAAIKVLEAVSGKYGFQLNFLMTPAGDRVAEEQGEPLPKDSFLKIRDSDACLKGPIGETARDVIVFLRKRLDLYANIRPFKSLPITPKIYRGVDFIIVRENTEDLYKGVEDVGDNYAVAMMIFTKKGCERIARIAGEIASERRKLVTIVHKSNILDSFRFFRESCMSILRGFDLKVEDMYVDNAAYQLIINPSRFDVILTPNMFGDILSDEAAGIIGTLGVCPSANIGDEHGLFEPVHGAAPSIDPKYANPTATILSAAMMLEWLGKRHGDRLMTDASSEIRSSIESVLNEGKILTPDMGGNASTMDFAEAIISRILSDN
ncbi:MAG: NAD-dependent isocitrate dehydrogenase [Thaumarchaeota archaeon]|nr:MAG: NAD-dependent isocitrate dehydrogenase [Nitrososphaerota archaeon]HDD56731.1 isocitrate/isopropylmalate dehydrogenase family protein [Nitrososphaeria archaeon]